MDAHYKKLLIRQLARAVLIGEHSPAGITRSITHCLGIGTEQARALAVEISAEHLFRAYPHHAELFLRTTLQESTTLTAIFAGRDLRVINWPLAALQSQQNQQAKYLWQLPVIKSAEQLADFLDVQLNDLYWFAQRFAKPNSSFKQQHYYYRFIIKSDTSLRLLEIPKSRLRCLQRTILKNVLQPMPVHEAAHGFVKNKNCASFAEPHVAKSLIVSMDLENYFLHIPVARITRLFQVAGYPVDVASLLAGLCTHRTPNQIIANTPGSHSKYLHIRHLPQGAPTSPMLANLASFWLDVRLNALAKTMGYHYTRYADDLAFSCDSDNHNPKRLIRSVSDIIQAEGFRLNHQKTRVQKPGQRQCLAGLVVNEKLAVPRNIVKQLQAELYNCVQHGPESQNRLNKADYKSHLAGRIAQVAGVSNVKAEKLFALFDQISWPQER